MLPRRLENVWLDRSKDIDESDTWNVTNNASIVLLVQVAAMENTFFIHSPLKIMLKGWCK